MIADIRRSTRAHYHLAVKHIKHKKDQIKATKLANFLLSNKTCDFWTEIKQIKSNYIIRLKENRSGIAAWMGDRY